jgi:hypothetical protein
MTISSEDALLTARAQGFFEMADKDKAGRSAEKKFEVIINGERFSVDDPVVEGRKLLRLGGFNPADEHVLIQILRPGTQSIGLDEEVSVDEPGREEFRAFASDRTFSFTVDEVGYEWGAGKIDGAELRDVSGVADGMALILEGEDEPDQVIEDDTIVNLAERGTEHIRTGKRLVTVYYKDDPFELERGTYTGAQLAATFNVPAGYILDFVQPDGQFDEVTADERVHIKEGMHFVSHPPSGQSS